MPFIDLLLCCVMFLLVTAVWNQLASIPATNPTGNPVEERDETVDLPMTLLRVTRDGCTVATVGAEQSAVLHREGHVDAVALHDRLTQQRELSPGSALTVTADDGVAYVEIMRAMDVARGAGFADLQIADGLAN